MCPDCGLSDGGSGAELTGHVVHLNGHIPHSWLDFILGCHVVQRASRRHLFGSCQVGDVPLLPLRRVTLENVADVTILELACELDQGLICASLGHIHTSDGPRCLKQQVPSLVSWFFRTVAKCTWGQWSCPHFNVTGMRIESAWSGCIELGDRKDLKLRVGQLVGRCVLAGPC